MELLAKLKAFRQAAYKNLCKTHGATFELQQKAKTLRKSNLLGKISLDT